MTGSADEDQIDNAANNVVINSYEGSNQIRNWGTNVTIDAGEGNDSFYNDSSTQNVIINAGNGDDSIPNSGSLVTIRGGAGSDTIINLGTNVIIDAGDDNDVIIDGSGSEVSINGGAGNDSIKIYSATGNVTINTGEGDDTINALGSSLDSARVFQVGSGKNLIQLTNVSSISVTGSDGAEEVKIHSPIYSNQASLQSATFTGGAGNDTIYGTSVKDVFDYNGNDGNDVIVNYGGEDTIFLNNGLNASNVTGSTNGDDVILNIATGTITLKDMKGHSITVTDANGSTNTNVYGNTPNYTQHDAIKTFMSSLDKTTLSDKEKALDEAVVAASKGKFTGIQNAIDTFISDCTSAADADTFLKYYCGILLDDADTGAITGWDVSGLTVKDADSVVPESGATSYPSDSSINKRGLTLTLPTGTLTPLNNEM